MEEKKPEEKKPSEQKKRTAKCPHAKKCGGCQYQGLSYPAQLRKKQERLTELLGSYGKVEPIIGMKDPAHYRYKVQAAFGLDTRRHIVSGTYAASTHDIVPLDSCMIENENADAIIVTIRSLMREFRMTAYDETTERGFLRHVLVRKGYATGQVLVVLVAADPYFKLMKPFREKLLALHPEITTLVLNINDRFTSMVLGTREKVLYGLGYIEDELCGLRFRISSRSFYQVNPVQAERLYRLTLELAAVKKHEWLLDAYCGTGTIGLCAAAGAGEVVGVELNADAVRDAVAGARANGIRNARFAVGDAGEFLEAAAGRGEHFDVVIMDPPRSGSSERFLRALLRTAPERLVYVSCGPETLARDLKTLTAGGYRVRRICPVDMFPFTEHVETVVLLSKGEIDSKRIRVEFPLEDMEITTFREKATYPQIKEYVLKQTGLKVSSLYISQVKRKCGLEVGDSYNKPKSEDAKVPQCPPEKEKAIIEALKHFGMIS